MAEQQEVNLIDVISYTSKYVRRNKWQILIVFFISVLVFAIIGKLKKQTYTGELSIATQQLDYTTVYNLSDWLLSLPNNNIPNYLKATEVQQQNIATIEKIEVKEIEPHPAERRKGCEFSVVVESNDQHFFEEGKYLILNYYNAFPFVQQQNKHRKKELSAILKTINNEIQTIKALRKTDEELNFELFLPAVSENLIQLQSERLKTLIMLESLGEFQLLKPFQQITTTTSFGTYIIYGFLLGILLNLIRFSYVSIKAMIVWNDKHN